MVKNFIVSASIWLFFICFGYYFYKNNKKSILIKNHSKISTSTPSSDPIKDPVLKFYTNIYKLKKNEKIIGFLERLGLSSKEIKNAVNSLARYINFKSIQSGFKIKYIKNNNSLISLFFYHKKDAYIELTKAPNFRWKVAEKKINFTKIFRTYRGKIDTSLWSSGRKAGVDLSLVSSMTDLFEYQLDFSRQVQKKDRWVLVVQEKILDGKHSDWGPIYAAKYWNKNKLYEAYRFITKNSKIGYYDRSGRNVRGLFLRSPISYQRITSRFRLKRFHPILKVNRPHYGVDYSAPRGTPVRAVGKGRAIFVGYSRGGGNSVIIKHNKTYKTTYRHLSRFAKNIKRNRLVQQGTVIGYVGSTGLSTGPHLHFEFHRNNRYVDPLGRSFPRKNPLNKQETAKLNRQADELLLELSKSSNAELRGAASETW